MYHALVWVHPQSSDPVAGSLDWHDFWEAGVDVHGHGITIATVEQTTLEQLADLCDSEAHIRRNDAVVGAHRCLAVLLQRHVGREQATHIMWEIARYGGLDAASGHSIPLDTRFAAWADLGIAPPPAPWTLPTDATQPNKS